MSPSIWTNVVTGEENNNFVLAECRFKPVTIGIRNDMSNGKEFKYFRLMLKLEVRNREKQ